MGGPATEDSMEELRFHGNTMEMPMAAPWRFPCKSNGILLEAPMERTIVIPSKHHESLWESPYKEKLPNNLRGSPVTRGCFHGCPLAFRGDFHGDLHAISMGLPWKRLHPWNFSWFFHDSFIDRSYILPPWKTGASMETSMGNAMGIPSDFRGSTTNP